MRVLLLTAVFALGPFGCPSSPSESETDPQPDQPELPAEPATPDGTDTSGEGTDESNSQLPEPKPATGPETLSADVAQSKVGFAVSRATIGHIGHFERFRGRLMLRDGKPEMLEIAVETESVVADRAGLTSHLKSADFFDVAKYPTASFRTQTITTAATEDEPNVYQVEGTMTLHGVEGALAFPATIVIEPTRVLGRATLDISAKRFGIDYAGMEAELADDAVALEIELVFPRVGG